MKKEITNKNFKFKDTLGKKFKNLCYIAARKAKLKCHTNIDYIDSYLKNYMYPDFEDVFGNDLEVSSIGSNISEPVSPKLANKKNKNTKQKQTNNVRGVKRKRN